MQRVVHVTTFVHSGGGMQSIVRRHRAGDAALGYAVEVVAIFERAGSGRAATGLGAGWSWTPGKLRRHFAAAGHARTRDALVVYHNAWAMPLLAPGDGAARRVAFLHSDWPGLARRWPAIAQWSDRLICVNASLAAAAREAVPDLAPERVSIVPYPVEPVKSLGAGPRAAAAPPRVGYVGRLECEQKRVGRLVPLIAATGAAATWDIVGDGPERGRLERRLAGRGNVRFHGWLGGGEYWRALAGLDAVVFTSDFEGTPIALLEAMTCGAIPLFPAIGGDGESLARAIDPRCVYPAGNLDAAAAQLRALLPDGAKLRPRCREAVAGYTPERHDAAYAAALGAALQTPRVSSAQAGRRTTWSDALPLALVRRCYPDALWR